MGVASYREDIYPNFWRAPLVHRISSLQARRTKYALSVGTASKTRDDLSNTYRVLTEVTDRCFFCMAANLIAIARLLIGCGRRTC
jgi:hypothetical protein